MQARLISSIFVITICVLILLAVLADNSMSIGVQNPAPRPTEVIPSCVWLPNSDGSHSCE